MFALAFVSLAGAAVGVAIAHFRANEVAPWFSIALAVVAIACTVAAVRISSRR